MTPIFIISYNRYNMLKQLVDKLIVMGQERLIIIDNDSTYEPLLNYYRHLPQEVELIRMDGNYGHLVLRNQLWIHKDFRDKYELDTKNYCYTDSDILPMEDCPNDFMEIFEKILNKYTDINKVGFALNIDDIPLDNKYRNDIINWERQFWNSSIYDTEFDLILYKAAIDTTFSYQRAGTAPELEQAFRTGYPYMSRHLPWYLDFNNLNEEDINYINTTNNSATWARRIKPLQTIEQIKRQNDGGVYI